MKRKAKPAKRVRRTKSAEPASVPLPVSNPDLKPEQVLQQQMQAAVSAKSDVELAGPGKYQGGVIAQYGYNPCSPSLRADIVPSSKLRDLIASTKLFDQRNNLSEPPEGVTALGRALYSQVLRKMSDSERATLYAQGDLQLVRAVVMERVEALAQGSVYVREGHQPVKSQNSKIPRRAAGRSRSRKRS